MLTRGQNFLQDEAYFSLYLMVATTPTPPRYLNIHIWYEAETYTRHISWQKMTVDDVIILVTQLGCNWQTWNKMRNRYPISGSIATTLISNFVRYVTVTKKFTSMTPSWQSHDLDTIYRPDRKWGPDFVSQVLYALLTSTLSDMLGWHKIWIYDIIMVFTWLEYNIQTR